MDSRREQHLAGRARLSVLGVGMVLGGRIPPVGLCRPRTKAGERAPPGPLAPTAPLCLCRRGVRLFRFDCLQEMRSFRRCAVTQLNAAMPLCSASGVGPMVCDVCGGRAFEPSFYTVGLGRVAPAFECRECTALVLDEGAATSEDDRYAVRLAIAIRRRIIAGPSPWERRRF